MANYKLKSLVLPAVILIVIILLDIFVRFKYGVSGGFLEGGYILVIYLAFFSLIFFLVSLWLDWLAFRNDKLAKKLFWLLAVFELVLFMSFVFLVVNLFELVG